MNLNDGLSGEPPRQPQLQQQPAQQSPEKLPEAAGARGPSPRPESFPAAMQSPFASIQQSSAGILGQQGQQQQQLPPQVLEQALIQQYLHRDPGSTSADTLRAYLESLSNPAVSGQARDQLRNQAHALMSHRPATQPSGQQQGHLHGPGSGQLPGQLSHQLPGQLQGQFPGQLPGQLQGQPPVQLQSQLPLHLQELRGDVQLPGVGTYQAQHPGQLPGRLHDLLQQQQQLGQAPDRLQGLELRARILAQWRAQDPSRPLPTPEQLVHLEMEHQRREKLLRDQQYMQQYLQGGPGQPGPGMGLNPDRMGRGFGGVAPQGRHDPFGQPGLNMNRQPSPSHMLLSMLQANGELQDILMHKMMSE